MDDVLKRQHQLPKEEKLGTSVYPKELRNKERLSLKLYNTIQKEDHQKNPRLSSLSLIVVLLVLRPVSQVIIAINHSIIT